MYPVRRAWFIPMLAGVIAALWAIAASGAPAQDSGIDQYLENPPAETPDEGGGSGGGGGGSGGGGGGSGGGGGGSAPSGGAGPVEVQEEPAGGADTAPSADGSGGGEGSQESKAQQHENQKNGATHNRGTDSVQPQTQSSPVDDSGSGGIGILLPIILGALLVAAIIVALVRRRRRTRTATA